jgi:hypothetical protein
MRALWLDIRRCYCAFQVGWEGNRGLAIITQTTGKQYSVVVVHACWERLVVCFGQLVCLMYEGPVACIYWLVPMNTSASGGRSFLVISINLAFLRSSLKPLSSIQARRFFKSLFIATSSALLERLAISHVVLQNCYAGHQAWEILMRGPERDVFAPVIGDDSSSKVKIFDNTEVRFNMA